MCFLAVLLLGSLLAQGYLFLGKIISSKPVLAIAVQGEQEWPSINPSN